MTRLAKQLLFGGIYLAIILAIAWYGYRFFVPAPTCTDGVQNGKEDGLDCGALACGMLCASPVVPLSEPKTQIISNSDGSYDVLATLENPNAVYGTKRVDYVMTATDGGGKELAVRRGFTYVNPAQPRYLVFSLGKLEAAPAKAVLQLNQSGVEWAALTIDAAGSVEFAVRGDSLTIATSSARYEAIASNRSRFDFDAVDVTVLLYDSSNTVVGAGSTILRTLLASTDRGFNVDWPFAVAGAARARTFIGTNIFSNENYLKQYGSPDRVEGN